MEIRELQGPCPCSCHALPPTQGIFRLQHTQPELQKRSQSIIASGKCKRAIYFECKYIYIYIYSVFWIGANCLLHPVLLCTCQKSVVICMYFYLKLNRWNKVKLISGFSQWSAKTWLMLLTRVLTIREQLSCALLIYFCTHKIHFTIYLYSLSLCRNVWHTCHPHICSMTKPPEENVVWGSSSMISLKLRGALKRKTYYCAFAKPFSACLLGSLGKRQFGSCQSQRKIVETGFSRIFPPFTGLAFLWILSRLKVVMQKDS